MNLLYKSAELTPKDIDAATGTIQVYVSAFNSKDSDGDVITPGAYTKTVSEWGPTATRKGRIWFLKNHNTSMEIAKPSEIKADHYGLLFTVKMPNTVIAKDLLELYREGHITEHSVGFHPVKQQNKSDYNEITEIRLYEGSAVLWGANENTPTVSVKSLEDAVSQFELTRKSLRNGKFTDETFELLEYKLIQLENWMINHVKSVEANAAVKNTAITQPDDDVEVKALLKRLETKLLNMKLNELR